MNKNLEAEFSFSRVFWAFIIYLLFERVLLTLWMCSHIWVSFLILLYSEVLGSFVPHPKHLGTGSILDPLPWK